MIEPGTGNLLQAPVEALVNTVNTRGVMGKGLALQFKRAFPAEFLVYARACRAGEVQIGRMQVIERLASPRFLINFPTKAHWRQPSQISYVLDGLSDLVDQVRKRGITSIAIPPLGCGNGGLDWAEVRPLIEAAFEPLPAVKVLVFEPAEAPAPAEIIDRGPAPTMTQARAAVLALMGRYLATGYDYRLSLLEVQKLSYFLQVAGEPLRLAYAGRHYGPYAENLQKALRNLEGHYICGIGDGRSAPGTPLALRPGALEAAEAHLAELPEALGRLERVARLIEGFESPFGMELLGTVHWVMGREAAAEDLAAVVAAVHRWSPRKRSLMKDGHIGAAWRRLHAEGWA